MIAWGGLIAGLSGGAMLVGLAIEMPRRAAACGLVFIIMVAAIHMA